MCYAYSACKGHQLSQYSYKLPELVVNYIRSFSYIQFIYLAMDMSVSVLCTCLIFKGKPFEELGARQQRTQKAKIRDTLNTTCSELNNIDLSLKSAELESTSRP